MAGKFNELLKTNPDEAAEIIVDGLRLLINTSVPGVYMTKVEWDAILPKVVEKMSTMKEYPTPAGSGEEDPATPPAEET